LLSGTLYVQWNLYTNDFKNGTKKWSLWAVGCYLELDASSVSTVNLKKCTIFAEWGAIYQLDLLSKCFNISPYRNVFEINLHFIIFKLYFNTWKILLSKLKTKILFAGSILLLFSAHRWRFSFLFQPVWKYTRTYLPPVSIFLQIEKCKVKNHILNILYPIFFGIDKLILIIFKWRLRLDWKGKQEIFISKWIKVHFERNQSPFLQSNLWTQQ